MKEIEIDHDILDKRLYCDVPSTYEDTYLGYNGIEHNETYELTYEDMRECAREQIEDLSFESQLSIAFELERDTLVKHAREALMGENIPVSEDDEKCVVEAYEQDLIWDLVIEILEDNMEYLINLVVD